MTVKFNSVNRARFHAREEARGSKDEVVAPGRVELPTFGLGNRCSIHLSYGANLRSNHSFEIIKFQLEFRCPPSTSGMG